MAAADLDRLEEDAEGTLRSAGIPPCPAVLTQVLRESRKDEPDFRAIGALLGGDVALSGTLLKAVNSPVYGLARPASSVQQALSLLGLVRIARLLTGLLLRQAFPSGAHAAMERFWEHSANIAQVSALVARRTRAADADVAHTFGLFRDCGMAVMLANCKGYAALLDAGARRTPRLLDAEQEAYGTHHARTGARLAHLWLLPSALCAGIEFHHSPDAQRGRRGDVEPAAMRLIAIGALAERACLDAAGEASEAEVVSAADFAEIQLGLAGTERAALAEAAAGALYGRSAASTAPVAAASRS